jgi:hypothetical protein
MVLYILNCFLKYFKYSHHKNKLKGTNMLISSIESFYNMYIDKNMILHPINYYLSIKINRLREEVIGE